MNEEIMKKIEELVNKDAIKTLIYKYADFLDARDYSAEAVKKIFTEDGRVRFPTGSTGEGYEGVSKAHVEIMGLFVSTNHNVSNEIIEMVDEAHANAKFHIQVTHKFLPEIAEKADGDLFIVNDRIRAEVVKTENGWRMKKIELEAVYTTLDKDVDELPIAPPVPMSELQYKDLMVAVPNPNHTRKECQDYLVNSHAYRAMSVQSIKDVMVRYTMNEVITSMEDIPSLYRRTYEQHLIIEHVTTSRENYLAALDDPGYLEKVRPDEFYMVNEFMRTLPDFYSCEEHIVISDKKEDYTGEYRIFDFLKKHSDISKEEFILGIDKIGKEMSENPAYCAAVHKRIHNFVQDIPPLFGNVGPYDAIIETFVDDPGMLVDFYPIIHKMEEKLVDAAESCTMFTKQHIYVSAS